MRTGDIAIEDGGAWHRVVLTRPDAQNSLHPELVDDLIDAAEACSVDPDAKVFVLEGTGGHFCGGMDLRAAADGQPASGMGGSAYLQLLRTLASSDMIVVSLVDGAASGGGLGLLAASDFVYSTARSRFALPEALWGLLPCIVAPFLIRRIGAVATQQLALSTRAISAEQALTTGLVDAIVDSESTDLLELLKRVGRVPEGMARLTKSYISSLAPITDEQFDLALDELDRLLLSDQVLDRLQRYARSGRFPWEHTSAEFEMADVP